MRLGILVEGLAPVGSILALFTSSREEVVSKIPGIEISGNPASGVANSQKQGCSFLRRYEGGRYPQTKPQRTVPTVPPLIG
jgi:hypothetical protein